MSRSIKRLAALVLLALVSTSAFAKIDWPQRLTLRVTNLRVVNGKVVTTFTFSNRTKKSQTLPFHKIPWSGCSSTFTYMVAVNDRIELLPRFAVPCYGSDDLVVAPGRAIRREVEFDTTILKAPRRKSDVIRFYWIDNAGDSWSGMISVPPLPHDPRETLWERSSSS